MFRRNRIINLPSYDIIEEVQDGVHAVNHEVGEDFTEEEDEHVDDNNTVLLELG